MEAPQRSALTCIMEDQKMDLGPVLLAIQNEALWKYLALSIDERKGFLLVAMFQAA